MKKLFFFTLIILGFGVILFHSCDKDSTHKQVSEKQILTFDDTRVHEIIAFIEICKFHNDNPGLKSEDYLSVDSAITYIEASMNYMYAYNVEISEICLDTSILTFDVQQDTTIEMEDVASLLDEVTDSVNVHYQDTPYSNKKLIAISIDYYIDHNDYNLKVISATGNTITTPFYDNKDWRWGELLGSCDGVIQSTDAAEILQNTLHDLYFEDPPSGTQYTWPNPQIYSHLVGPDIPSSYSTYLNLNDPDGENNHLDYVIFYNDDGVDPYTNSLCLLKDDQMPFYKANYIDLVDDALNINSSYKYKSCDFNGKEHYFNSLDLNVIRHELSIIVGVRWTYMTSTTYPTPIE